METQLENSVLMGIRAQEQYLFGAFAGFVTDLPTRLILGTGSNPLITRLLTQAIAMIINAFWIVMAIKYYKADGMSSLKLIPFQAGLFSMQPEFANNATKIVEEIVGLIRPFIPFTIPVNNGPPPPPGA